MNKPTRIFLGVAGGLFLFLIAAIIAVMAVVDQSRQKLAAYKALLEQKGETLAINKLVPPPAPEKDNGAAELIRAGSDLGKKIKPGDDMLFAMARETAPGRLPVTHRAADLSTARTRNISWEEAGKRMQLVEPDLEAIRAAASLPALEAYPNYAQGYAMPMVGLTETLKAGQYLNAQCLLFLHENRIGAAIANIEVMLRMAKMMQRQNILISELVAASLIGIAQTSTWLVLQSSSGTEADLARLQTAWAGVDIARSVPAALRMERAWASEFFLNSSSEMFKALRSVSPASLPAPSSSLPTSLEEALATGSYLAWSMFFRYADEKYLLQSYQKLIDASPGNAQGGSWASFMTMGGILESEIANAGISRLFSRQTFVSIQSGINRLVATQAMANLTATAIALRRYHLARGKYPGSLDELAPDFLPAVINDPFDGAPLRYRPQGDEFLLYSIGSDLRDDGGDVTTSGKTSRRRGFLDGKDIVWPLPEKP